MKLHSICERASISEWWQGIKGRMRWGEEVVVDKLFGESGERPMTAYLAVYCLLSFVPPCLGLGKGQQHL